MIDIQRHASLERCHAKPANICLPSLPSALRLISRHFFGPKRELSSVFLRSTLLPPPPPPEWLLCAFISRFKFNNGRRQRRRSLFCIQLRTCSKRARAAGLCELAFDACTLAELIRDVEEQ